jgi:hypothetical protein
MPTNLTSVARAAPEDDRSRWREREAALLSVPWPRSLADLRAAERVEAHATPPGPLERLTDDG